MVITERNRTTVKQSPLKSKNSMPSPNLSKEEKKLTVYNFDLSKSGPRDNKIYFCDWLPGVPLRIATYSNYRAQITFRYFNTAVGIWIVVQDLSSDEVYSYEP